MNALRRHVVSMVAVLLALATGIALGAGPLAGAAQTSSQAPTGSVQPEAPVPADDFAAELVAGTSGAVLDGRLTDRRVVVLAAPGADQSAVASVTEMVGVAGGRVSASLSLGETLVAPTEKTLVDTLGEQLAKQNPSSGVDSDTDSYDRMGRLLGRAVLTTRQRGEPTDRVSEAVLASLSTADMLVGEQPEVTARAPYVVVVLGDSASEESATEDSADTAGPDAIWSALLGGLAAQARGTVVLAPAEDPALGRLREEAALDDAWADIVTVDADGEAAAMTAVLALAQWPTARGHAFGVAGSDGARVMD